LGKQSGSEIKLTHYPAGIDFVRVDLYEIGDQIKFGELTCYPESGMGVFTPDSWDEAFGRPWVLPDTRPGKP
jgi:hypothetical protein